MTPESLIGKEVTITAGWSKGEWGIVKHYDGDLYHIALWNGDTATVFARNEFRVKREKKKEE